MTETKIGRYALALQAHGHGDVAAAPLAQALAWFRSRPPSQAVGTRSAYLMTLDAAGLWDEARTVAETMAQEGPAQSAWLGVIAAHQGDTLVANRVDRTLATANTDPWLRGGLTYDRARIAAVLGHHDEALALLRDAFAHGADWFNGRFFLRFYPEFRSLQNDPWFKQLLVPAYEH